MSKCEHARSVVYECVAITGKMKRRNGERGIGNNFSIDFIIQQPKKIMIDVFLKIIIFYRINN